MKEQTPLILALDVATPEAALDILDEAGDSSRSSRSGINCMRWADCRSSGKS
jgi:orotidine-5'-phosphate decarboxylase